MTAESDDDDGDGAHKRPRYKLEVCPLFAALPQEQQLKAFRPVQDPATTRKVTSKSIRRELQSIHLTLDLSTPPPLCSSR